MTTAPAQRQIYTQLVEGKVPPKQKVGRPADGEMTLHGLTLDLTGWWQIGWSHELAVGQVLAKRYFGRDLVVYRGTDGNVVVHDRYCQHLGASLAHSGCVTDEGIQCPFHGWVWGPDGKNVSIPYQDRPNKGRGLVTWPVVEVNDTVYIWNDSAGREPLWEVVDATTLAPHAAKYEYHPISAETVSYYPDLSAHPQMVIENAVDPHHFRFVHRTPTSPVILEEEIGEWSWWARVGFGRRWSERFAAGDAGAGEDKNTIEFLWNGMGISVSTESMPDGIRIVAINTTPVDDQRADMFATYWISKRDGDLEDGSYDRRLNEAKVAMPDDLNIWDNQIFIDPPSLATSEGKGFRSMRRWTQRFYPADSQYTLRNGLRRAE